MGQKTKKIGQKWAKSEEKPKKPVENKLSPLTLPTSKPHCNHRQGSSKPHEYRGFVHAQPHSHLLHAVRISRRKPGNKGSPEGSPRRRKITWQLE
jgi:hypothetical protein